MKRSVFLRYFAFFFAVVLVSFALLIGYMTVSARSFAARFERETLEKYAQNLAVAITDYMTLDEADLPGLMENRGGLLRRLVSTRASQENLTLFLTDEAGKVLLSSDEGTLPEGTVLPPSVMEAALDKERQDPLFSSDLGGFLKEAQNVRAIPMEQTNPRGQTRTAAVAFAVSGQSDVHLFLNRLMQGFFIAAALVLVITLVAFLYMSQMMNRPVRLLSEAAARYAKGDFSQKLPERGNGDLDALMVTFNEMADRLEQNEKKRRTFVANVSHDLRTPMTAIGGYAQNMLEERIPPEKQKHYLQIILNETERLSRMVDSLLDSARLSGGAQAFHMQPMDLCELARVTLLSFETILEELDARVTFDARPERLTVLADKDAVQRVIFNLVDNAAKFTPHGGEIRIRIREQDKKAVFSIRNTGDGIPPEELPHLFDQFYKSDRSRGLDKRGMGLGLFIAKSIINAHGEEIWVTSQAGGWTEFVFTLPLRK